MYNEISGLKMSKTVFRPAPRWTAGCACNESMELGCVGGLDLTPMTSQLLGCHCGRDTTQVMLGVSLRARWGHNSSHNNSYYSV